MFFFFQAEDGIRDLTVTGVSDVCSSDLRGGGGCRGLSEDWSDRDGKQDSDSNAMTHGCIRANDGSSGFRHDLASSASASNSTCRPRRRRVRTTAARDDESAILQCKLIASGPRCLTVSRLTDVLVHRPKGLDWRYAYKRLSF